MRRIVYFFLMLCLPLYGFAMQGDVLPAAGGGSIVHDIEHAQGVQHHHEEDGSVHYDDSDKSLEHAQEHSCCAQPAGLAPSLPVVIPKSAPCPPGAYIASLVPEPFLDGPQRPPAFFPGHAAGGMLHA